MNFLTDLVVLMKDEEMQMLCAQSDLTVDQFFWAMALIGAGQMIVLIVLVILVLMIPLSILTRYKGSSTGSTGP